MDLIQYFVTNFDITKYPIKANIYSESMNCNALSFVIQPYDWWVKFRIASMYNEDGKLIRRRIVIENADFLGEFRSKLEEKLTGLLADKKFIDLLNFAIQKEKDRTKKIYDNTMLQSEIRTGDETCKKKRY